MAKAGAPRAGFSKPGTGITLVPGFFIGAINSICTHESDNKMLF